MAESRMVKQLFMARIHVTGASGSGTTTLGHALSGRLAIPHFDSDDYYWIPTVPPYRIKRDKAVRDARIGEDIRTFDDWVWSGSSVSWQHGALDRISLCVFLTLPPEIRLGRLRTREEQRFRAQSHLSRCDFDKGSAEFLEWAARYDNGGVEVRSLALHEQWMATLDCRVLRLDGDLTTAQRVNAVLDAIGLIVDRNGR
jgi:adenylate kinase family enzyme